MTFYDFMLQLADDEGRVTWDQACDAAQGHGVLLDWLEDHLHAPTVSVERLLWWLGYGE